MLFPSLLLTAILQISIAEEPPELTVVAQTSAGPVRGFEVDYGSDRSQLYYGRASIFLGVPFAKPPVGDRRFKLPVPLCHFEEDVGSTAYKPRCPQLPDARTPGFVYETSEDCLYLNVFTPNITDGRKRAVLFYVHGGAYKQGGADIYHYKGAVRNLVSRDVVVVVTQYRLSALGFFTTFSPEFPANRGVFDVLLALRWTQNEIANFGGDPDRVTIWGHSSGATITDALTYSPLAKGLFKQVIIQSGPILDAFNPQRMPQRVANGYGQHYMPEDHRVLLICNITDLRFDNQDEKIPLLQQCFKQLSGEEMAGADVFARGWGVVLDGVIFPLAPHSTLARAAPNYPLMRGTTQDEYAFSMGEVASGDISGVGESTLDWYIERNLPYLSQDRLHLFKHAVLSFYDPDGTLKDDDHLGWTKMVSRVISDHNFLAATRRELQLYKNKNNSDNVFLFNYNYVNTFCTYNFLLEGWAASIHCSELCFLWFYHYDWEKAAAEGRIRRSDFEVAEKVGLAFTNFAKYGNPGWAPMRDHFDFVQISDTVSDMRQGWGEDANTLFNEVLPALLKTDLPPYYMEPAVKERIELQAPRILGSWLAATCPTWKPLNVTELTVYPLKAEDQPTPKADIGCNLSVFIASVLLVTVYHM